MGYPNITALFTSKGYRMSSPYGYRTLYGKRDLHRGIDFAAPSGTKIPTPVSGRVIFSGVANGYGNVIGIEDSRKYVHVFGHNSKNLVRVGQSVKAGDTIALVGSTGMSTGPHVHYQVNKPGTSINGSGSFGDPSKYPYPNGSLVGGSSPAPIPVKTAPSNVSAVSHRVVSGDTLSEIAVKYGTTVSELQRINGIKDASLIHIGQIIKLKTSVTTHTVKRGETLSGIALKYKTTVPVLQRLNGIKDVNLIRIGQVIKLK
jgi:murein DD-endopeptidase MepM/ murein hydrolase activator NlpD